MSIKIIASKVNAKSIASNQSDLSRGYRLETIRSEGVDQKDLSSMLSKLRNLAHSKEKSAGTVNQINMEAARITASKLTQAIEKVDIQLVSKQALSENPLLSTVSAASNVLKFVN